MKKIIGFLALSLGLTITSSVLADNEIKLYIDDNIIESDVAPQIIEGRTMVPVRPIFEGVGAEVIWDAETKTITGKKGDIKVVMSVDSNIASVNGVNITMDCGPVIFEGRTLAPARYVAEAFGADVNWDNASRTVNIKTSAVSSLVTETTTSETTVETTTETTTFETTTNPMYTYDTYYAPGSYTADKDIPKGEYVVFANPGAIGYVAKFSLEGGTGSSNKKTLFARNFNYCDIIKIDANNYAEFRNAYAVPLEDASVDISRSGTFKAGSGIKTGHITFKLSPNAGCGYVEVGLPDVAAADKTIEYLTPDHNSVVINVTSGQYVRVFGCDILSETLSVISEYKPVTENNNHTDTKYNFNEITPVVKTTVDDYIMSVAEGLNPKSYKSGKYTDSNYKSIVSSWNALAKTSADRKYIELAKTLYRNIISYAKGTNGSIAYSDIIKMNGKEIMGVDYRNILDAERDMIVSVVKDFKGGTSFEELEVINKNFYDYKVCVPRVNGSKVR